MDGTAIERHGEELYRALRERFTVPPLTDREPGITIDDARFSLGSTADRLSMQLRESFLNARHVDRQEPCRTCPINRQHEDFGGCRCQALALTGDAAATDPVCQYSPHHDVVVAARREADEAEPAEADEIPFVYRTLTPS